MFAGYITRLRDNYPASVQAAGELAPRHHLRKKTRWLPSHPRLEEVLALRHTLTSLPRLFMGCPRSFHVLPFVSVIPGVSVSTLHRFDRVTEVPREQVFWPQYLFVNNVDFTD